ncbi:hypothetical protein D3C87_1790940 [compost metagenome]
MRRAETLTIPVQQLRRDDQHRAPARRVQRLHTPPRHGHAHAQADGLGKRFLGGKAGRQKAHAAHRVTGTARMEFLQFFSAQDLFREPVAMPFQRTFNPVDAQQVHADASDGACRGGGCGGGRAGGCCGSLGGVRHKRHPKTAARDA